MKIDDLRTLEPESFVLPAVPSGKNNQPMLGDLFRAIYRVFNRRLQDRIGRFGVNMGQWFYLNALWNQDGITQRELSRQVGMMEPTTVTALNVMEQQGHIERKRDPSDRRKVRVRLTEKARKLRPALMTVSADLEAQARASLKEEEIKMLVQVLTRVLNNLNNRDDGL